MLVPIQRMTEAEALANLSPYSDNNKNSTSWMFLDVDDNDTLKGLFYNDAEPNEKEVRPLSKDTLPIGLLSITKELNAAEIADLHNTSISITPLELGLSAGKAAVIYQPFTLWSINPDGVLFVFGNPEEIQISNSNADVVSRLTAGYIKTSADKVRVKFPSPVELGEFLLDNTGFEISATDAITGGGAEATITVQLFYSIEDVTI